MAEQLIAAFKPVVGKGCAIQSVVLVPGGGGIFEVKVDGDVVFSKHQAGRFPSVDEIVQSLRVRT